MWKIFHKIPEGILFFLYNSFCFFVNDDIGCIFIFFIFYHLIFIKGFFLVFFLTNSLFFIRSIDYIQGNVICHYGCENEKSSVNKEHKKCIEVFPFIDWSGTVLCLKANNLTKSAIHRRLIRDMTRRVSNFMPDMHYAADPDKCHEKKPENFDKSPLPV